MLRIRSLWAISLLISMVSAASAELTTDFVMDQDPEFRAPDLVKRFKRDFKGLWLQALQKPETDMQRMAAETVARAHRHGIPDLIELVPALETILTAPSSHPAARFSAARALIVLESRNSAPKLFEAGLSNGSELRQLIEPALAEWDFAPVREVWIKRLDDTNTRLSDAILAINGLGKVRDASAVEPLRKIYLDLVRPASIRLEAAQAAGGIVDQGLERDAATLIVATQPIPMINQLCAVRLLERHSSEEARELLVKLANGIEPSISASAMTRLNQLDPELVTPLAEAAMKHPDQHVREQGANAYLLRPTEARIKTLSALLEDSHPAVRKMVAERLYELAEKPEFDAAVRSAGMQALSGSRWQGQSQASLLLGKLNHKPAADRFLELLESTQPEVMNNVAWGLRKLAEPHTGNKIVEKIRRQSVAYKMQTIPGIDDQLAHLYEACGSLKIRDAEESMIQAIPKDLKMIRSRSAAIWALGKLNEGTPREEIFKPLMGRFHDVLSKDPEDPLVRQMCVVTIVRMNGKNHATAFRDSLSTGTPPSALGLATRWAVQELLGETLPEPEPDSYPQGAWFLEPIDLSKNKTR